MYPPPSASILQRLKGALFESVCFGKFTVHLTFDDGNRISFGAPFRFGRTEVLANVRVNDFPLSDSSLVRALGCSVHNVACDSDGTLSLNFTNGDAIVIYSNNPMYEAYTLLVDGQEYVV